MTILVKKSSALNSRSLLVLSRNEYKAVLAATEEVKTTCKKPLVLAFGTPEIFGDMDVVTPDVAKLADDLKSIQSLVTEQKYDGILLDSMSFLRRLMNIEIAEDGATPTQQQYGIVNSQIVKYIQILRASAGTLVTTAAFVIDDDATKRARKDVPSAPEVWDHDLTSNLRATLFPFFGEIWYLEESRQGDEIVKDRDYAVKGIKPRPERTVPQRTLTTK